MGATYRDLPPECLLRIITLLSRVDITALLRTSAFWYSVITQNESAIYHRLAELHDPLGPSPATLEAARRRWVSPAARSLRSWKEYYKLQVETERRWSGDSRPSMSTDLFGSGQRSWVHRIKIDVGKLLLVMTAIGAGGPSLTVHCLENHTRPILFQLKQIAGYAHLEMSSSFVVFTCEDSTLLEVWRWAEDQEDDLIPVQPTTQQTDMYENAMRVAGMNIGSPARRGQLVPMGILQHPADLRASRLVYPTMCVGARAGDQVWLWDIRTRQLIQTITFEPSPFENLEMLYIDVNETHVFVASHTLSVYSRITGQCVFQFWGSLLEQLTYCTSYPPAQVHSPSVFLEYAFEPYRELYRSSMVNGTPSDIVQAVHVSPTGDDFVAITFEGFIFHVSGLKEATLDHEAAMQEDVTQDASGDSDAKNEPALDKFKISVNRGGTGLDNLAYDGNRIVANGSQGLCIIDLVPQPEELFPVIVNEKQIDLHPFPAKVLKRVPEFWSEREDFGDCSCVQISQEAIWIAWQPMDESREGRISQRKTVGMILFSEGDDFWYEAAKPLSKLSEVNIDIDITGPK